jgi:hypothetical protein
MDYVDVFGNNLISNWRGAQSIPVQTDFDAVVRLLSATPDWSDLREFKKLDRAHVGLGELRFKTQKVQYRPVGFFGKADGEFVLLLGCSKSGRVYTPLNAFDLALRYKADFENKRGGLVEHTY